MEVIATATIWSIFSCLLFFPRLGLPAVWHRTAMALLVRELLALGVCSYAAAARPQTTRHYVAGGRELLAGIGSDTDGSVVIGIVFGSRRWFATPTPAGLFDAMTLACQPVG